MSEFSPGVEGVLAARTQISMVDGQNGRLIYRGYVIADLAETMSYEEVAYLLWYGDLPTREQLDPLSKKIAGKRQPAAPTAAALKAATDDSNPMDGLRTAVSAQGTTPTLPTPDIEHAIACTAVVPTTLA